MQRELTGKCLQEKLVGKKGRWRWEGTQVRLHCGMKSQGEDLGLSPAGPLGIVQVTRRYRRELFLGCVNPKPPILDLGRPWGSYRLRRGL